MRLQPPPLPPPLHNQPKALHSQELERSMDEQTGVKKEKAVIAGDISCFQSSSLLRRRRRRRRRRTIDDCSPKYKPNCNQMMTSTDQIDAQGFFTISHRQRRGNMICVRACVCGGGDNGGLRTGERETGRQGNNQHESNTV